MSSSAMSPTSTTGIPRRNLLLSQIYELRQELEQANIKNKSQEHQLDTWQRRMESNPTELDSMLSDMTNKTASLEEVISKMEAEADHMKSQHKDEVESLSSQLSEVRQQADESRASEQEAQCKYCHQ